MCMTCSKLLRPESFMDMTERVTEQIRTNISEIKYMFDKESDVLPPDLLILIHLVIKGSSNHISQVGFSLPVKTIAQLIVFNHKKERTRKPTWTSICC